MRFHQKLVMYYILDYFRIVFILDINYVLREFRIVGSETFEKKFVKNSEGLRYC